MLQQTASGGHAEHFREAASDPCRQASLPFPGQDAADAETMYIPLLYLYLIHLLMS